MMKGEIDTDEHGVLDQVKGLLRKYEKYRVTISYSYFTYHDNMFIFTEHSLS